MGGNRLRESATDAALQLRARVNRDRSERRQSEALAMRGWARAEQRRLRSHRAEAALLRAALSAPDGGYWSRLAGMAAAEPQPGGTRTTVFVVEAATAPP
ncbi:MAG TPA: hypothetical protein VH916_06960 [Dehalococcoidia bacterium]|jgi:hypothetical protein